MARTDADDLAALRRRRDGLMQASGSDPDPAIAAAIKHADAEIAFLKDPKRLVTLAMLGETMRHAGIGILKALSARDTKIDAMEKRLALLEERLKS